MFDAWKRIVSEEGIMALWTGCGPTIGRAMVVNVCQLCCQTQAKEEIAKRTLLKEGYILSFLGAMIAGFINSCVSLPIDIAKTRLQNMKVSKHLQRTEALLYDRTCEVLQPVTYRLMWFISNPNVTL